MIAGDTLFTRSLDIPAGLSADHWLAWKPNGRHKVPIGRNGKPCDPVDRRHWLSFTEARQISRVFGDSGARVGYALPGSGLTVLDLDRVIDAATGEIAPEANALIDRFDGTYIERSVSGLGVHIILSADLPAGNRRTAGLELLTDGFIAITGHALKRGPISPGGESLLRIVQALPPASDTIQGHSTPLPTPMPGMVADLIGRAMPNARFRKLLRGDWSEYPSRSEADAGFAMHLARNAGDLVSIVAALRQSGLARPKLSRDDYCCRTVLFAIATADVRRPNWRGLDLPPDSETLSLARQLLRDSALARDAELLLSIARFIAHEVASGRTPDLDGYWRVSPAMLAGDFPGTARRLMSRRGALKALHRLAAAGVFSLHSGTGSVRINGTSRTGRVTLIRVAGRDVRAIVDGFLHRSGTHRIPCVCCGNCETLGGRSQTRVGGSNA